MNHLSLFNGIGGFQLAASWMGWNNVAHVEIADFCNKVVANHFPDSQCFTDIKQFDGKPFRETIDIISGGFPCQPFSVAGKQGGDSDDRFLWPEMLRVIREIQPNWIVGENVPGIIGMALDQVLNEMESEGYSCQTFIIPASGVGAWHKRERVWIVAYSVNRGPQKRWAEDITKMDRCREIRETASNFGSKAQKSSIDVPNSRLFGSPREEQQTTGIIECSEGVTTNTYSKRGRRWKVREQNAGDVRKSSTNQRVGPWDVEPELGRVANGIPNRVDRLKSLGNAIVPQVAYEIFKAIDQYNQL
jgi:DNA (cytosine-5)-methyltransferase 1